MPGVMADRDDGNVLPLRDPSPELRQRGCWGKLWCLGSRKRGMRIVPARPEIPGAASNAWPANVAATSTAANQFVGLSPSLLAPPSSPASFANSGNPSTVQSPAAFTVSLCANSAANASSPAFDSTATMFTIGPYAHETTLVTPPAFSAFTTAPSTAPFTPPPELAHLTTPSSPDVPFAQLLTSLKNKAASPSPFASPDYTRNGHYHLYPESPLTSLISPASGISESGPPSPFPEVEFTVAVQAAVRFSAGNDTPVSVGSNNHSRELEPIKILSPTRVLDDEVRKQVRSVRAPEVRRLSDYEVQKPAGKPSEVRGCIGCELGSEDGVGNVSDYGLEEKDGTSEEMIRRLPSLLEDESVHKLSEYDSGNVSEDGDDSLSKPSEDEGGVSLQKPSEDGMSEVGVRKRSEDECWTLGEPEDSEYGAEGLLKDGVRELPRDECGQESEDKDKLSEYAEGMSEHGVRKLSVDETRTVRESEDGARSCTNSSREDDDGMDDMRIVLEVEITTEDYVKVCVKSRKKNGYYAHGEEINKINMELNLLDNVIRGVDEKD